MAQAQISSGAASQAGPARRMRRPRLAFSFALTGAFSFWVPDLIVHIHGGRTIDARHGLAISVAAPAMFLLAYVVARRFAAKWDFKWTGAAMLLGVWFSGGVFMALAATASGSELAGVSGISQLVLVALSVIPIVTYILAAYDGSLFALLTVTVGALVFSGVRASWTLWMSVPTRRGSPTNESVSSPQPKVA